MSLPPPNNRAVLRALWRLTEVTTAVSARRIADYLHATEADVLARLRDLKGQRLARDKRRKVEGRVWEPWR